MLALCPDTRTPAKKILAKSTSSAKLPPVTVCPIYNRQDPTNKNCSIEYAQMPKPKKRTLVLLAIAVLLIAAVAWHQYDAWIEKELRKLKETEARSESKCIGQAIDVYRVVCGEYPMGSNKQILDSLTGNNPKRVGFILFGDKGRNRTDPWGEEYQVLPRPAGERPQFFSKGPNRINESDNPSADDIHFWQPNRVIEHIRRR
jgi:hypothetical protein